jgi:hypothetical protein
MRSNPALQEDVLYALSEADALQDLAIPAQAQAKLRPDGKAKMVYLLQPDGGSTPTLAYLRSVYNSPGVLHTALVASTRAGVCGRARVA